MSDMSDLFQMTVKVKGEVQGAQGWLLWSSGPELGIRSQVAKNQQFRWSPPVNIRQTCHSEALSSREPDLTCVTTATVLEHVYWKQCSVHHPHAATVSRSEADGRQFHSPLCWLVNVCVVSHKFIPYSHVR